LQTRQAPGDAKRAEEDVDERNWSAEAGELAPGTLTRAHLAQAIQDAVGFSRVEASALVEQVLQEIFDRIVAREEVKLSSFGSFTVREKQERAGRNPKTGETARIAARLVVVFKPSNILRQRVEGKNAK